MAERNLFNSLMPKDLLPDTVPYAQTTQLRIDKSATDKYGARAFFREEPPQQQNIGWKNKGTPTAFFETPWVAALPSVKMHELGHAIWFSDLSASHMDEWAKLHNSELQQLKKKYAGSGRWPWLGVTSSVDSPSQSFAESFSQYAIDPNYLKQHQPEVYKYFSKVLGFEYSRKTQPIPMEKPQFPRD